MVAMVLATAAAGLALLSDRNGFGPQLIGGRNPAETRPVTDGPIPTISADDPFEGSPAARYADGAAGIVMPEPRAMAGLGKAQVADLYRRGRELIIAGRLDRTMVLGGAPDAFAKRLDPTDRRYFVRRLNHRDPKVNTRYWISSLAPHSAGLAGSVIKVHGTVKVSATGKYGRRGIMMRFNHIFVYPVYRPGDRGTLTRLVVHAETHLFGYRESGSTHLLLVKSHSSYTPARCDIDDGFIHPFFEDSAPDKVGASGRPQDPYELTPERNDATDCGASEGT